MQQLKPLAKDQMFQREIQKVKQENKFKLTKLLEEEYGIKVNPTSLFDIQVGQLFFNYSENMFYSRTNL